MKYFLPGVLILCLLTCITGSAAGNPGNRIPGSGTKFYTPSKNGACLVVSRFPEGCCMARFYLEGEDAFSLSFIHSVSETPVRDCYNIRGAEIVQTRGYFRAHGAGLPSHPNEPGGLSWEKKGNEFVLHMKRPIPKLVVRTDRNYQNRLFIGKRIINLNQWEDQALLIYVDRGSADSDNPAPLPCKSSK